MPEGGLAAAVFSVVGIEVVVEQRPFTKMGGAARHLPAEGGHARADPLPGNVEQQPLSGAVVLGTHVLQTADVYLPRWHVLGGQPGAAQIGAGNKILRLPPGDGHHQPGIVVVDDKRQLEHRLVIYRLRHRRWRQHIVTGIGPACGADAEQD